MGREILNRQTYEGYGTQVINRLSADLRRAFSDSTGFSPRNLRYVRAFAAAWPDVEIVQRTAAQLPWRHHQFLLDKLDSSDTRLCTPPRRPNTAGVATFSPGRSKPSCWNARAKPITNFAATLPPEQSDLAQQATKDPYLFDFLGTTESMFAPRPRAQTARARPRVPTRARSRRCSRIQCE